jgi:hypothetical protein
MSPVDVSASLASLEDSDIPFFPIIGGFEWLE